MDVKIQTLKQISIFSALDEQDIAGIASVTEIRSYKKNRVIFNQGDTGNVLFILISGLVKIFLTDKDGKENILKVIYEDDFFGEMSLLDGNFRSATIIALENSKALLIYREDLFKLIQSYPLIGYNMMVALSRRLRATNNDIASLNFLNSYGKVARVLLGFVTKRGKQESGNIVIDLPISRQEMAEMAGVSRETFSRILKKYKEMGCLKVKGKTIIITNQEILKEKTIV
ncbi:MAG: Crp/Fnr family transcriptional regulator [Candidatus Anammoxibacter sp.]